MTFRHPTMVQRVAARLFGWPDPVSEEEAIAAARARVTADKGRGVETEQWIVELAKRGDSTH
jgi:hypothetical protein